MRAKFGMKCVQKRGDYGKSLHNGNGENMRRYDVWDGAGMKGIRLFELLKLDVCGSTPIACSNFLQIIIARSRVVTGRST